MSDRPELTFAYIAEPPEYQFMGCMLLASIRRQFPASVKAIGYCPEHRMAELDPEVIRAHEIMGGEIRPMRTEGMWDTPYPHGNKIIAAMQPRDSAYSAFVDSDVLFLRPNDPANLCREGHVSCSVAASMVWAKQTIWDTIYGAFDLPVPEERVRLMRRSGKEVVPYFSAGLVVFPEEAGSGGRFPDIWYDTARQIDRIETLDKRRPYLDQMSLPVAIRRAGLDWNKLPEEQHYILGGRIRGKPLPEDRKIFTVHYRTKRILREVGLMKTAQTLLAEETGGRAAASVSRSGGTAIAEATASEAPGSGSAGPAREVDSARPRSAIDLARIRIGIINLVGQERRRNRVVQVMNSLGLEFDLIEAESASPRHLGCSRSHLKAIETLRGHGPFLVLEDDIVAGHGFRRTVDAPAGAAMIYLGHSPYGYSDTVDATGTPELTELDDPGFLRVHSMLAAHAILYPTDDVIDEVRNSIMASIHRSPPERHDIGFCRIQQKHRVLAVDVPFFVQSGEVQLSRKRELRQKEEDFVALPRRAQDLAHHRRRPGELQLRVLRTATGSLVFREEPLGQRPSPEVTAAPSTGTVKA